MWTITGPMSAASAHWQTMYAEPMYLFLTALCVFLAILTGLLMHIMDKNAPGGGQEDEKDSRERKEAERILAMSDAEFDAVDWSKMPF